MAEVINTNVFDAEKKFVDFAGLDYFWEKAKAYVDGVDKATADKVAALEDTVGDDTKGLIKDFKDLKAYTESLGDIEGGEGLGGMIDSKIAALDVEDAAVDGQYVSSVAEVDGKVVVTRANLPVYEEVGVAADAAAQALTDAKSYADGLKTTIDGVIAENERVTSEALNSLDGRVTAVENYDHEALASSAAAAAVATVLDGAPEKFDTLKEIAAWIAEADTAEDAASLVTRVSALEAIDHDAYVGADETVLASAKSYADGLVMTDGVAKFDAAGSAAAAETAAKSYADGKFQVAGNYEVAGAAEAAIAALDLPNAYDAKGAAATAKSEAIAKAAEDAAAMLASYYTKDEVNGLIDALNGNIETAQAAAETYAKTYTDALFTSFKFAENSDIDGLFA